MRLNVIYLIRIRERVIDQAVEVSVKLTSENDEYFANLNWECISSLKSKARRPLLKKVARKTKNT
jgi:pyruvate dehydrogenase complex dehydrogenase (E1) component